jgi:hypothetical protein
MQNRVVKTKIRQRTEKSKAYFGLFLTFGAAMYFLSLFFAQIPQDIPHQSEPVDFTHLPNILFYIGVPVLMAILYFFYFRKRNKK